MAYPAKAIANEFLKIAWGRSQEHLSHLKLQKLVHIAHGWHLARTGDPLIKESVEAWKYGPVVPELFAEFKKYGAGEITRYATDVQDGKIVVPQIGPNDVSTSQLIEDVWKSYGKFKALELANLTHQENTPWAIVMKMHGGQPFMTIGNDIIKEHYKTLMRPE